jgi:hypothetical protein
MPGPHESRRPFNEPVVAQAVPRVRALSRRLRALLLAHLEKCGAANAAEDMNRHPTIWKRLGERIHPYDHVGRFPQAAVAFAAVRSTVTQRDSPLGRAILYAVEADPGRLTLVEHGADRLSVQSRSFAAAVQEALDEGDIDGTIRLLSDRPGELWRRIDHLARCVGDDPIRQAFLIDAATNAASDVSPGVLASTAGELRGREATVPAEIVQAQAAAEETATAQSSRRRFLFRRGGTAAPTTTVRPVAGARSARRPPPPAPGSPRRVFFPRGDVTRSWTSPEQRGPLPAALVAELRAVIDRQLTQRAALLQLFDMCIIDRRLLHVPAPTRARTSSSQLAGWVRGTQVPFPSLRTLRLFLHWVEPDNRRVDLDLSCAFYRADWSHAGHCDYTALRFAADGAIHSGDLTSAPAPFGATEYLDLTPQALVQAGARYAIPVIFSFNDVPFDRLPEAFAGLALPSARDAQFDPGGVVQRFNLRGDAKTLVPFIVDLVDHLLLWVDVTVTSRGYGHQAGRHSANLGRLGSDLWDHFTSGHRPTLLDLVASHSAGRARELWVVDFDTLQAAPVAREADAARTVAGIRAAAVASATSTFPSTDGRRVLAAVADAARIGELIGTNPAPGSVIVTPVGDADAPWVTLRPEELLAGLTPAK